MIEEVLKDGAYIFIKLESGEILKFTYEELGIVLQ
jgi:hypothetical protein